MHRVVEIGLHRCENVFEYLFAFRNMLGSSMHNRNQRLICFVGILAE